MAGGEQTCDFVMTTNREGSGKTGTERLETADAAKEACEIVGCGRQGPLGADRS